MHHPNPGSGWWIAVRLPSFRLAAALRHIPHAGTAAYLIERTGRRTVLEATEAASLAGVRAGMTLREASRTAPRAAVALADPPRAARAWGRVLAELRRLPAPVADGGPGLAFVRAHRGATPERWFGMIRAALGATGLALRCGAAANRFTAFVAAHRCADAVCAPGAEATFVADAPLALLAVERAAELRLRLLGVRTLGHVAALSPQQLVRFGTDAARWHALACGRDADPEASVDAVT
ncbi:MAG TPA: hypothetical protein VGD01_15015 [Candidatus Elarobacter sp.]|jgi:hypothetical protein